MQLEKRGKKWRYRIFYKDDKGIRRSISKSGFNTKAEAKRAAIEVENSMNKGMRETKDYLLNDWLNYYVETWRNDKLSDSTIEIEKFSKKRLLKFYGNISIKSITPSKHQQFINDLIDKGYSKSTIKKSHSFLKRALQRAVYDRLIHFNPCDGVELKHKDLKEPQKAQYLPKDKIKPFLEMVKKRDIHQYYMFRTMIETGIRVGEANALLWSDYNSKDKTLSITKSYDQKNKKWNPTKNKENRIIYITDDLAKELTKLKYLQNANRIVNEDIYNSEYDFMFCNEVGNPIPRSTTHNTMKQITGKLLGKENALSIHKLRHTHATLLLESDVPMKVIQERLGHKTMAVTEQVYSHVTEQMNQKAKDDFEKFINERKIF
ncbi:site-specific integrase [Staphylococcus americanisciuri]|uniref:Tyrosine-type recombinase/integrase n=1 Tax=Staphylococcus americanisciuri TaxID=2973940 RepID=A0ABT2F1K6_9STAP|nr:tyrosine-type recombinase/integrase [Staphylococcus americanisciuri]MCS4486340.1 tyrosine-type recombinase/integrase [Staphylococcus americanisciuri]